MVFKSATTTIGSFANVLHLGRRHPDAGVVLATRDQNLKLKARRLGVTTDEPPPRRQFQPRRLRRPNPEVVLGHPGGQVSKTSPTELRDGELSGLVAVNPRT